MYSYMIGKVTEQDPNSIVLEVNGIGYKINVPNPFSFELEKDIKIYLYQFIREDENSLYGFKTTEEKDLFLKLISVKGIGPRTAIPFLATGSVAGIKDAIERENILYLKKFPKVGEKAARQIILDLKGKIMLNSEELKNNYAELTDVLKGLGYRDKDIKEVLPRIDNTLKIEDQVKDALKLFLK